MHYKIKLSYNGAAFSGWQIQNNAKTVQGVLEKALSLLLREKISVTGAGRTDAGVHAIGYIAHFDSNSNFLNTNDASNKEHTHIEKRQSSKFAANDFIYKLNAMTPREMIIHDISLVDNEFHARFDAKERTYKYFINRKKDPFVTNFSCYYSYPLDIDKMNEAAQYLIGTQDFSCFEKTGGNNKTSICNIMEAKWENYIPNHVKELGYPINDGDFIVFTIKADRFLRNMVRAVVGSLLEVGRGKHKPEWIKEVISSKDRCAAGESVPGNALFFIKAEY